MKENFLRKYKSLHDDYARCKADIESVREASLQKIHELTTSDQAAQAIMAMMREHDMNELILLNIDVCDNIIMASTPEMSNDQYDRHEWNEFYLSFEKERYETSFQVVRLGIINNELYFRVRPTEYRGGAEYQCEYIYGSEDSVWIHISALKSIDTYEAGRILDHIIELIGDYEYGPWDCKQAFNDFPKLQALRDCPDPQRRMDFDSEVIGSSRDKAFWLKADGDSYYFIDDKGGKEHVREVGGSSSAPANRNSSGDDDRERLQRETDERLSKKYGVDFDSIEKDVVDSFLADYDDDEDECEDEEDNDDDNSENWGLDFNKLF